MLCTNCDNKLLDEEKICSNCGKEVSAVEQQESTTIAVNPKEKKIKPKLGIVALALVVILALSFITKDYIIYAVSPETNIRLAVKKTMENIINDCNKMESFLFGNINSKKNNSTKLKLTIEDAAHTDEWISQDLHLLSGMGLDIETIYDEENKEIYFDGRYQIGGEDIISMIIKLDDNELQLNIPQLFEEVLSVPSKDFGIEWNDSALGEMSGGAVPDTANISVSSLQENNNVEEINEEAKEAYINALELMFKDANYDKSGTENLMIGGKSKKCSKTTITLQENNVKEGVIAWYDAIISDNRVGYWIDNYNRSFDFEDLKEAIEMMKADVRENFQMESFTIDLYINNGNIVKSEMEIVADKDRDDGTLLVNIELLGEKSLIDDFKLEYSVAGESFALESKGNHTGVNNVFVDNTKIVTKSSYGEGITSEFSTEIDLNKKKDNLKVDVTISVDEQEMTLSTTGDFNSSAEFIEFKSDNIYFTLMDYYGDVFEVTYSANFKTTTDITNKPDFSNYDKIELLKMDEDELYEFGCQIEDNAYRIGERIQELLRY